MVLGVRMSSIDHDFVGFFIIIIIIVVSGYFASFLLMGHAWKGSIVNFHMIGKILQIM